MENLNDLKQQRLIEQQLADAGLPQNKLNSLIEMLNEQIKCGPVCQQMQRDQNLKRIYSDAVTNYKEGPTKIKLAEKNYYEATKGSAFYNDILKDRYSKEIKDIAMKSIKQHGDNVKEIKTQINKYNSETIYSEKMEKLLERLLSENLSFKEQADKNKSLIYTNDRKTFYEDQQIENIYYWRRVIIALFWILFLSLCINVLFLKKKYDDYKTWIRLFIVALFPFYIIPFIQKIILKIYHLLIDVKDMLKIKDVYIDLK